MGSKSKVERGVKSTVDWHLVIIYLVLVFIGWINIYASVHAGEDVSIFEWTSRSGKQFIWMLTAFTLAITILFIVNARIWETIAGPAYIVVTFLLVAVIFLGTEHKGSRSWFSFGPVSFQPAEISKITTSLLLAAVMSKPNFSIRQRSDFLKVAIILGLPMLAILGESETGSALVYVGMLFMLFREGLSGIWLIIIGIAIFLFVLTLKTSVEFSLVIVGVAAIVYLLYILKHTRRKSHDRRMALWLFAGLLVGCVIMVGATKFAFENVLADHQRSRIEVLLGIKDDPSGAGYNVRQSMIAIGSGGAFGKGFLKGTQTTYGFVPEQSTDFIFCTVGEEWGFLGCLLVIILYGALITRIILDSEKCRESFTRIYGYCLASCLFMHLIINIGMTVGLMPVIGIPLPFLSYGGSSLWAFTIMLFIFIALFKQESKYF